MTRRDLVRNAIRHRETPRVPYAIDLTGEAWEQLRPHAGGQEAAAFLDNDVLDVGVPWWNWYELGPEWAAPEPPASTPRVVGTGSYEGLPERLKALRAQSDKYLLVRIYGSHFEKAYFARGFENFLADLGGSTAFARRLLERIIDKNLVMLENILALPEIDGVLLGSDWGSQRGLLLSPEQWDDLIRPGEQKEYDLIHACGKDVWVHSCGCIDALIPRLVEMGLDVLNPVQPEAMDLARLKRDFGQRLTFWGGISTQQTLPFGTPEEVRAEVRAVRDCLATGGGYILAPAQSIQADVPVANVLALLEVARETRCGAAAAG
jgi:uroporphyrinogen decarboxylase